MHSCLRLTEMKQRSLSIHHNMYIQDTTIKYRSNYVFLIVLNRIWKHLKWRTSHNYDYANLELMDRWLFLIFKSIFVQSRTVVLFQSLKNDNRQFIRLLKSRNSQQQQCMYLHIHICNEQEEKWTRSLINRAKNNYDKFPVYVHIHDQFTIWAI